MDTKKNKYTLFPIVYPTIYKLYEMAKASFWIPQEVDLTEDIKHWHTRLNNEEREYIKYILAFFAASDGIVIENLAYRFIAEITNSEGRNFYAMQAAIEAIHSESYSLMINTYVDDPDERNSLFNAIEESEPIKKKAEWAMQWTSDSCPMAKRILAFAIVEGVFFSGAFCSIYWLKDKGIMPGLSLFNDFISRDEGLHTDHACEQYKLCKQKLETSDIHEMLKSAIFVEDIFIDHALQFKLRGMNSEFMKQYVRFVADRLLTQIDVPKLYNATNPFPFMERISLDNKSNFFEARNAQYKKANVMNNDQMVKYQQMMDNMADGGDSDEVVKFAAFAGVSAKLEEWRSSTSTKLELSDDF